MTSKQNQKPNQKKKKKCSIFRRIRPQEILNQNWTGPNKTALSPNVLEVLFLLLPLLS